MVVWMLTDGAPCRRVFSEVTGALQFVLATSPRQWASGNMSVAFNTVNGAGKTRVALIYMGRNCIMSGWKVVYRDILDHDRIFPSVSSKEAALAHARNLH